jgi:hypothetical protein
MVQSVKLSLLSSTGLQEILRRMNRRQRAVALVARLSGEREDLSSIPDKDKRLPFLQSV